MKDLIVVLDSEKSKRQKRIVLKIAEGVIKITKGGTLSARLDKTDLLANVQYRNYSDKELSMLKGILKKQDSVEMSNSFFSISISAANASVRVRSKPNANAGKNNLNLLFSE